MLIALLATAAAAAVGVWIDRGELTYYAADIQWAPGISSDARAAVERRLSLERLEPSGDGTVTYRLNDRSRANVADLVAEPAIARTNVDLDRIEATTERHITVATWLQATFAGAMDITGPIDRLVRRTAVFPLFGFALLCTLALSVDGRAWLAARVPLLSPEAMALFRVAFAVSVLIAFAPLLPSRPLQALAAILAAAFAMWASRWPLLAFVALLTWVLYPHPAPDHALAMPLRTLWLMVLVPWHAGTNLWAAFRESHPRTAPSPRSRSCGLAVWIPVLMLGVAYAAAAFAKIDEAGVRWITGGGVKAVFLADAANAPFTFGQRIANSHAGSIAASAAGIAGESFVLVGAVLGTQRAMGAAGLVALGLHLGFWAFQGLWWPAWWALLTAFVPWQSVADLIWRDAPRTAATEDRRWPLPQVATVLLFVAIAQQPLVSLARREFYPLLLSDFPMYSNVKIE